MCEMSLKIVRYGLQCSEKSKISKSDAQSRKIKVVPMGWPGVENVPAPRESILTLCRGSQLPYTKKTKLLIFVCFMQKSVYFVLAYSIPTECLHRPAVRRDPELANRK